MTIKLNLIGPKKKKKQGSPSRSFSADNELDFEFSLFSVNPNLCQNPSAASFVLLSQRFLKCCLYYWLGYTKGPSQEVASHFSLQSLPTLKELYIYIFPFLRFEMFYPLQKLFFIPKFIISPF